MNDRLKILEMFGGIGAPRAALRNLGIPVKSIDYVEIDEKAVRSYNAMFQDDMHQQAQDIRGWNLKPDILIHGSPCQDFSIAGKQKGADEGSETRSSLMWETIHIIENMGLWKPRVVIWENVKNALSKYMIKNFNRYLSEMECLGYKNSFQVLNAKDFGLPQNRERVYTVSILDGPEFDFSKVRQRELKPLSEFLTDYKECHVIKCPSMLQYINHKVGTYGWTLKVLDPDKDVVTCITTAQDRCPNSGIIDIGNGKYRLLTEQECWRLQGFSDSDYESALKSNPGRQGCKNSTLYRQAGNSMPVPVLESIFEVLLDGNKNIRSGRD